MHMYTNICKALHFINTRMYKLSVSFSFENTCLDTVTLHIHVHSSETNLLSNDLKNCYIDNTNNIYK